MKGILWATIAIIIPSFVFFYGYRRTRGTSPQQFAGEIDGRKIPLHEYLSCLRWVKTVALMQYGKQFENIAKFLNLEEEAWKNTILLRHAKLESIKVSDDELASLIRTLPIFHKDGKFNKETYKNVLLYALNVSPDYFEEGLRKSLCISRLRHNVTDGVKVSHQELKQHYRFLNEKVKIKYVLFRSKDFEKEVSMTEKQIRDYFESHREEFREPPKVKFQYILLKPAGEEIHVTDSEIEDYYSTNIERYKNPEDKNKTIPLKKVKGEIKDELQNKKAMEKVEEDGEELLSMLEEGEKKWRDLPVKETDFMGKNSKVENLPQKCIDTSFSLEIGETSNLLRTKDGFYITKLVEKKESHLPENFKDVIKKIEEKLKGTESKKLARSKAEKLFTRLEDQKKKKKTIQSHFSSVAKEYSKEVMDTDFFTRNGYIKGLGMVPEFRHEAFTLSENKPSSLAAVPSGFCVLIFQERKDIEEDKFEEEKSQLKAALLSQKREMAFQDWFWLLKEKSKASYYQR